MSQEKRLNYLIEYLLNESKVNACIPNDISGKKKLFRSLVNIREPKVASEEFLKIQDEYLKYEINSKGITDSLSLPLAEHKISLWQGDITTLKCSAIVNAANSAMLGCFVPCHKCIDNAIHTFSGIELRLECEKIMRNQGFAEKIGKAKITNAYNLPCDYIIHTVGPFVGKSLTDKHCMDLMSCYNSCFDIAELRGIKTIAFPCISTGEFCFPNKSAAEIAVNTIRKRVKNTTVERVIFNVFKNEDREIYERLFA